MRNQTTGLKWLMFWLWALACPAFAQAPSYDTFSNEDGEIATKQQEVAAIALVRNAAQLEAVYSDAAKGNVRAQRVWQQLEATFTASGVKLAEMATGPGCLVMVHRELSKECSPRWSFLDFLATDKPGANRLREVIFRAFAIKARERGLENQLILSAASGLIAVGTAAVVLREAEVAANAVRLPKSASSLADGLESSGAKLAASSRAGTIEKGVADRWAKGTFNDVTDSMKYHLAKHGNGRSLQQYTEDAVKFFERNRERAEWGRWNPNWEPSYRLKIGNQGGYYTADGRVLSYWD